MWIHEGKTKSFSAQFMSRGEGSLFSWRETSKLCQWNKYSFIGMRLDSVSFCLNIDARCCDSILRAVFSILFFWLNVAPEQQVRYDSLNQSSLGNVAPEWVSKGWIVVGLDPSVEWNIDRMFLSCSFQVPNPRISIILILHSTVLF